MSTAELHSPNDIAIVGMACRFPGARTLDQFWDIIREGRITLERGTRDDMRRRGVPEKLLADPNFVPAWGTIEDMECFDAAFFDIGPRDAAVMDPQARHFLELAWEALESAGHVPTSFPGSIGVYAGSGQNTYLLHNLLSNPNLLESLGMFALRHTANDKDFLSTTISYRLDLHGPSVNVQTACSTSLVAIHVAAQALLAGECDLALAGGSTIDVQHDQGYVYRPSEILAPDGVCRPFERRSGGTVLTSGAGVVALRRLEDALADGDHIWAIIKATAINNDGAGKVGYLAPSVDGHASVAAEALDLAGLRGAHVQYVEAHGTGTEIGDPIEMAALSQAYADGESVHLGSTKANIGHTDTAAGVASIIKTALALNHAELPPLAGFAEPNPLLDIESTPFTIERMRREWPNGVARRAGVSSLGVGGTNAHAILQEPPRTEPTPPCGEPLLMVASAKAADAADRLVEQVRGYLRRDPAHAEDAAFTLQVGRAAFRHRRAFIWDGRNAVGTGSLRDDRDVISGEADAEARTAFLFPGGGAFYPGMGSDLYRTFPVYREALDRILSALDPTLGAIVRSLLLEAHDSEEAVRQLQRPSLQLPAVFATEYALGMLLMGRGVVPSAMLGHSLGEYTAATLAGVFTPEDAAVVVALRGELLESIEDSALTSVLLPADEVARRLPATLSLAVVNGPQFTVVSGHTGDIASFEAELAKEGIECRRVRISAAAHSSLLDPVLPAFEEHMRTVPLSPPVIPFVSNVSGTWMTPSEATDPTYWVRHLRSTVRFGEGLVSLAGDGTTVLLEVGPGTGLSSLARQQPARPLAAISCMPGTTEVPSESTSLLAAVAQAWARGAAIDWEAFHPHPAHRIPLPTYPFERTRHWIEPGRQESARHLDRQSEITDWFWRPTWKKASLVPQRGTAQGRLLLVGTPSARISRLAADARQAGFECILATFSGRGGRLGISHFELRPGERADYEGMLDDLRREDRLPDTVVFVADRAQSAFALTLQLLALAQGIAGLPPGSVHELIVLAERSLQVDTERVSPDAGAVAGALRVAANELGLLWRYVDLDSQPPARWAARVIAELGADGAGGTVAWRRDQRWLEEFDRLRLPEAVTALTDRGVYVITGGLGGVGLSLARHLAATKRARLALVSRTALPERAAWDAWLAEHDGYGRVSDAIVAIRDLEAAGAEVLSLQADVVVPGDCERALDAVEARFGRVDGVFHAAGQVDDALIGEKTENALASVLGPKVAGARNLVRVARSHGVDFVVLFSSTSARLGLPGQLDYAAANAFMDHLAAAEAGGKTHVVSIGWSPWRETGMAAERFEPATPGLSRGELLELDHTTDWRFLEHEIDGIGRVMPGTGLVELLANRASRSSAAFELRDLGFRAPLTTAAASVAIRTDDDGSIVIASSAAAGSHPTEHARASLAPLADGPGRFDLAEVLGRCRTPLAVESATSAQSGLVRFGERWDCLRSVQLGEAEAVASIELGQRYLSDLDRHSLHPAILDLATGFAFCLNESDRGALFVPLGFDRIRVFGSLPARVVSHVRLVRRAEGLLVFDGVIADTAGSVLVEFDGYQVRKLQGAAEIAATATPASAGLAPRTPVGELARDIYFAGLRAPEGFEVLDRILAVPALTHVVVTPVPLPALVSAVNVAARGQSEQAIRFERPSLETSYEQPADEVELALVRIWEEVLGVAGIGVDDDFFDLGGHSLLAVRMFNRVRDALGPAFPLSTLFEAGTVRALAVRIRGSALAQDAASPGVAAEKATSPGVAAEKATSGWRSLVSINPIPGPHPLFCIHGMTGNVLFLRDLAARMPKDVPFYALQARGLNGEDAPHETIEEMAAHYIAEIRSVQAHGPYMFAGYSGGGLIAFEMARQLREAGEETSLLAFLDCFSPRYLEKTTVERVQWFLRGVKDGKARFVAHWLKVKLASRLGHSAASTSEGDQEAEAVEIADAFVRAQAAYLLRPLDVDITLFRAEQRAEHGYVPRDLGWTPYVRSVDVHVIPGGHESMCLEPNVTVLASELARARKEAIRGDRRNGPGAVEPAQVLA